MVDHYLDDFVTMGPPDSECRGNLDRILAICADVGIPLATDKHEGPVQRLIILSIELDTQAGIMRLLEEKLSRLKDLLTHWSLRKSCQGRQLESLVGSIQHACRIVKPGRTFLRWAINLLRSPGTTEGHHHVQLNREFRADLQRWKTFVVHWNGMSMLPCRPQPTFLATSDAYGRWGCGAWSGSSWFQFRWPTAAKDRHISFKELFAGLVSAAVWGKHWRGTRVQWRCDNQHAVQAVCKRFCHDHDLNTPYLPLFVWRRGLPLK